MTLSKKGNPLVGGKFYVEDTFSTGHIIHYYASSSIIIYTHK